jgi:hypothetical protein
VISNDKVGVDWAHIEHLEDPVELRFPTGNLPLVVTRRSPSNESVLLGPFVNPLSYFLHSPAIENR